MYSKLEVSLIFVNCQTLPEAEKAWRAFRRLLVYHNQPFLQFIESEYRARIAVLTFGNQRK